MIVSYHICIHQVFELYNAGDTQVGYRIDTAPFEVLKAENYLMPVFECLQPQGTVSAHSSAALWFVFSPVEARKYTVSQGGLEF